MPAWVKVLCPSVTELVLDSHSIGANSLIQPATKAPMHLQSLDLHWPRDGAPNGPAAEHVRQQLQALPSLTSLTLHNLEEWAGADEQQARRLLSSTVTRLRLTASLLREAPIRVEDVSPLVLPRLPTQFPHLRELDCSAWPLCLTVDDAGLEALLSLPDLRRVHVNSFSLQRSYTHRVLPWRDITIAALDVDSLARLPLDSIHACGDWGWVRPSADPAAVARLAAAVGRWGGRGRQGELSIEGSDVAALLTTLGPLVNALTAAEQDFMCIVHMPCAALPQLGQHLSASITTLCLHLNCDGSCDVTCWSALLPSLPASVGKLLLWGRLPDADSASEAEQWLLALCQAAVRPIRGVLVRGLRDTMRRIRARLVEDAAGQAPLVTLEVD